MNQELTPSTAYGWYAGGKVNTQQHWGAPFAGHFDFSDWAFQVGVIYTVCGIDGLVHARFDESYPMNWVWQGLTYSGHWARD
ncbi:MAG TPA: hypothetical protein VLZ30_08430 [Verrucomicrobiae bacterium]|nr:hypothetical protein [Verrucomicrobiae bacterium]